MQDQRCGAAQGDGRHVAFRTIAIKDAAEAEQCGGQGSARDHVGGVPEPLRQGQPRLRQQVHRQARDDADDQRGAQHPRQRTQGHAPDRQATAAGAREFHHRDPEGVEHRRMDRDDRPVPGQRIRAVGAFRDRYAQEQRVREKTHEPDRHAVHRRPAEQEPGAPPTRRKGREGAGIEGDQQLGAKLGAQVQTRHRHEEQRGDREVLREIHQPIDTAGRKPAPPCHQIAEAHDQEDGQDDREQRRHVAAGTVICMPSKAGSTWSGVWAATAA